jgi:LmbE family N-acetylglucosaminyl deacetylase
MAKKGAIVVICAHSDDQIFGSGGTMAKYAKEGHDVYTIVFSFGEKSHPHFKTRVIRKMRIEESIKANKIIGGKQVMFLGLQEGKFEEGFMKQKGKERLVQLLRLTKPEKIFTHAGDDSHADHRAVHTLVLKTVDALHLSCSVYSFPVWNLLNFRQHNSPRLVVDISDTFKKKILALRCFRSQINVFSYTVLTNILFLGVYVRAILNGFRYHHRYAEVFILER